MTGSGRPMCRHEPPQACSRWWCTYKYGVYVSVGFLAAFAAIVVYLNHGSILPPSNLSPPQSTNCPLC